MFHLYIHHRLRGRSAPGRGASNGLSAIQDDGSSRHVLRGGADVLLEWIETQLGQPCSATTSIERIVEHLARIEQRTLNHARQSFRIDPLATSTELLRRRDVLRLNGWTGAVDRDRDGLIADLAAIETGDEPVTPGEPERIESVLAALDDRRPLPAHCVHLDEPAASWPELWHQLFERLETVVAPPPDARGREPSQLRALQEQLLGAGRATESLPSSDVSLTALRASSLHQACHTIAVALSRDPSLAPRTAIICEDDDAAQLLDQTFNAAGLPTMGSDAPSVARPALQVLPLVLELSWKPVDPQLLLDLLALPVTPIPRRAGHRLARALVEQPGFGSDAWTEAWAASIDPAHDPDGKVRTKLDMWLSKPAFDRGTELPASHIIDCATRVERWASRYAAALRNDHTATIQTQPGAIQNQPAALQNQSGDDVARSLELAARQAKLLGRIVTRRLEESPDAAFTEPQLAYLVDEVQRAFSSSHPLPAHDGAPRRYHDPADVIDATTQWIWLGVGTSKNRRSPWSPRDRVELHRLGVGIDDGTRDLHIERRAERRAFAGIEQRALFLELPSDDEKRPHSLVLAVRCATGLEPVSIESLVTGDSAPIASAWGLERVAVEPSPPAVPGTVWRVDPALIPERPFSSASELEARFACPLKWTLNYAARLRPSNSVDLKRGALLKGDFEHRVLERVFRGDDPPMTEDAAELEVRRVFNERLPLDAAPLAQPSATGERHQLEAELAQATRTLVRTLNAGGYRVVGMEEPLRSEIDGRQLRGSIDCVVVDERGEEAVIDFKFGSAKKYRSFLAEGKAIQLATYAAGRATKTGLPPVAYLILVTGELFTPSGSALRGATAQQLVERGPPIGDVWRNFTLALRASEKWLSTGEIPVRPLRPMETWPLGSNLALDPAAFQKREQPICRYCDYGELCGLEAVR